MNNTEKILVFLGTAKVWEKCKSFHWHNFPKQIQSGTNHLLKTIYCKNSSRTQTPIVTT